MSLRGKVSVWESLVNLAHTIVHGDKNTSVATESGPVDTFAKVIESLRQRNDAVATGIVARAEAAAVAAASAQNAAETARDEAAITSRVYATPAAGVAAGTGVAIGQFFNVRSTSSASYVDEYLNLNGSPVATGKSYPSAEGLEQALINNAAAITRISAVLIQHHAFK